MSQANDNPVVNLAPVFQFNHGQLISDLQNLNKVQSITPLTESDRQNVVQGINRLVQLINAHAALLEMQAPKSPRDAEEN